MHEKTVLAAGTVTTVGDASYQVTKSDVTAPTVAYRQATDKSAKKVTVPSNVVISGVTYKVTDIEDNAFKGNKKLTLVTIPTTVVTIGKNAFKGIYKKAAVKVPKKQKKAYIKLFKKSGLPSGAKIK